MSAGQFQTMVLTWIGVATVIIPLVGGLVALLMQQGRNILDLAAGQGRTEATVAGHDRQLNGELTARIQAEIAKAAVAASPPAPALHVELPSKGINIKPDGEGAHT